jgi:3-deoxy-manno-octulosonate cytidylyltransferase (CMP-KDO synthetase)
LKSDNAAAILTDTFFRKEYAMPSGKVAGIIPARYASTRLPGKALAPILGKSMIQRVCEQSRKAESLDRLLVATDDSRIREAVETFGGEAVMTSPDHPSGTDRVAEAAAQIDADIIVNIQGDQPFLDPVMIDEAVQPLLEDPDLPMSTLMHPVEKPEDLEDPGVVKTAVDRKGNALYFSRALIPFPRDGRPRNIFEHVGLYVYRKDFLLTLAGLPPTPLEEIESLEQLRVLEHGYKLRVVETCCADNEFSGFSIDTPEDLKRAESMLRERG